MKKLFLLLLLALPMLVACGDDDENDNGGGKEEPVYLDNKLIEGRWYHIWFTDSTIYIFENDRMTKEVYDKYGHYLHTRRDYGMYRITETKILTPQIERFYILDKDTLFIRPSNTDYFKYVKLKDQEASL